MATDYSKAKIYKIVCEERGLQYFGSTTTTLERRLLLHESDFARWTNGKCNFITSYTVMELGRYHIELVEKLEGVDCVKDLCAIERRYIETNECVNHFIPGRTLREWKAANREKIRAKRAEYRAVNKEKLKARASEKIPCPICCTLTMRSQLARHQKSKKCQ